MEGRQEVPWQIRRFCRQYLQVVEPSPDYPDRSLLRKEEIQEHLYNELFAPNGNRVLSPPPGYALRVLKTLMAKIETSIDDWDKYSISDGLMVCLAELARSHSVSSNELSSSITKHGVIYCISELEDSVNTVTPRISLMENRSTIAAFGTTGIRTWEAALHLGNYLCRHPHLVEGKTVLELGAGTGFVSILCASHLGSSHCIASDGSIEVVDSLPVNIELNNLSSSSISPKQLLWGDDTAASDFIDHGCPDLVLGADITFDEREMPSLLRTIRNLADLNNDAVIIIAATERNKKTYGAFVSLAGTYFLVEEIDFPVLNDQCQSGPFYSSLVPIRICQLRLRK